MTKERFGVVVDEEIVRGVAELVAEWQLPPPRAAGNWTTVGVGNIGNVSI